MTTEADKMTTDVYKLDDFKFEALLDDKFQREDVDLSKFVIDERRSIPRS